MTDTHGLLIEALKKAGVEIDQNRSDAIKRVICTRGKNKGRLLAKCPAIWGPNADEWAAAAWLGIQPNPWKMRFSGAFIKGEPRAFMDILLRFRFPAALDRDLHTLKQLGVA